MSDYHSQKSFREQAVQMLPKCSVDAGTQVAAILAVADMVDQLRRELLASIEGAEESDKAEQVAARPVICPEVFGYGIDARCERPIGHDGPHKDSIALYGGGIGNTWTTTAIGEAWSE